MKSKTKTMVLTAILIAVMLLFGFTPIGYIPLPFAKLTLMCIPLVIGTLLLGLKVGFILSGVFIFTSIFQLFTAPDAVSLILFESNPAAYILCLIVPRVIVPLTTTGMYKAFRGNKPKVSYAVSAAVGSLTNTFIYLTMLQLIFVPALCAGLSLDEVGVAAMIWGVVLSNGLPEAAAAALISMPICASVKKAFRR